MPNFFYLKLLLIVLLALTSKSKLGAQVPELNGVWVLNHASVVKVTDNGLVKMNLEKFKDDPFFALFDTLQFNANTLKVTNVDYNFESEGICIIHDNKIEIPFTGVVFYLEYDIIDYELNIKQFVYPQDTPLNNAYQVSIFYKKENNVISF